jgi:hypothetical protein
MSVAFNAIHIEGKNNAAYKTKELDDVFFEWQMKILLNNTHQGTRRA